MNKYLLLFAVLAISTLTWFKGDQSDPEEPSTDNSLVVEVVSIGKQVLHEKIPLLGTVFAIHSVEIKPESEGKIKSINVIAGQTVKEGEVLIELDNRHQLAVVKREQARLIDSERQYKNYLHLQSKGAVTQTMLDSAETQWLSQQADLLLAEAALQDKTIVAPFSGKVGLVDLSRGQLVTPTTVLTTLDDDSLLRLNVPIAARHLQSIRPNQQIQISSIDHKEITKQATLTSIDSRVNSQNLNVFLQFSIDNKTVPLTPGSLVSADLEFEKPEQILVPLQSIVYEGDQRFVYRVESGLAAKVPVQLGDQNEQYIQVLSGLSAQDEIVYKGTVKLHDGVKVVVKS